MTNVQRFVRTVAFTPAPQLLNRLWLKGKRETLIRLTDWFPTIALQGSRPTPPLADPLPLPLLSQLDVVEVTGEGEYTFRLLNCARRFCLPVQWHLPELNAGTRLWKLHLHYFDYTDRLDDASFEALISDWIAHNRPYRDGYWLDSWNSYALSIRVVSWMGELARRRARLNPDFKRRIVASIAEQLQFLARNLELDIRGNHIIRNVKALYWGSTFFAGEFANFCSATADQLLERELQVQILRDGFHFERSPAYHCQVFGDLMDCWRHMRGSKLRDKLAKSLHQMAQVTADLSHPDGAISLFNDGGLDMSWSPNTLLEAYQALFGKCPNPRSKVWFEAAGYYVARSPSAYLVYDAGAVGPDGLPAHAHGDIFAFELSLGPHRVFVDPGVFEYDPGERRTRSRSTVAHNTLTLDDQDQCEFWGAFRMGRRANVKVSRVEEIGNCLRIEAEHTGYTHLRGRPIHKRILVIQADDTICVEDIVRGGDGQIAASRLLLHPDVMIDEATSHSITLAAGAFAATVRSASVIRIAKNKWWPNFGQERQTYELVFEYGRAPGRWGYEIETRNTFGEEGEAHPTTDAVRHHSVLNGA